jgi:hypothetical protein
MLHEIFTLFLAAGAGGTNAEQLAVTMFGEQNYDSFIRSSARSLLDSPYVRAQSTLTEEKVMSIVREQTPYKLIVGWNVEIYQRHFDPAVIDEAAAFMNAQEAKQRAGDPSATDKKLFKKEIIARPNVLKFFQKVPEMQLELLERMEAHFLKQGDSTMRALGILATPSPELVTCPDGQKPEELSFPAIRRIDRGCTDAKGKQGKWVRVDRGRIKSESTYKDDTLHGEQTMHHTDGAFSVESWKLGLRDGLTTEYDEHQKRVFSETFVFGKRMKVVQFGEDGKTPSNTLSKRSIAAVMRRFIPTARVCYEVQLAEHPELAGEVFVTMMIQPNGQPSASAIKESTMKNEAFEKCLLDALKRVDFPKAAGRTSLTYPFTFSAE